LINGNWDYDDDPNCLMDYPTIMNIFIDKKPILEKPKTYISADIAFTSDNAVIMVWEELTLVEIIVNPEGNIEDVIKEKAKEYKTFPNNISYDSDGVGKYLMNYLKSAKPIVNNGKPLKDENYENLKTQLYFKLAEVINSGELKVLKSKYDDKIIEELQQVKHRPTDRVSKISMVNKGDVKRMLGRSPDFSDAMAYRMIFEIKVGATKTFKFL
jgi:phage terminase large subunit